MRLESALNRVVSMKGVFSVSHEIIKLSEKSNQRLPVKLLYISHSRYDKEWHSTLHNHHFTELFYIKNGNGSFIFEEDILQVRKGDFVVINPNIEHTEKSSAEGSLEYIALSFEGLSFALPEDNRFLPGIHLHTDKNKQFANLMDNILVEMKNKGENFEIICQNLLELLILLILREGRYHLAQTDNKQINSNVYTVKRYIDQFYKKNINLDKLAEVSHMSKYYMAHSFKAAIGLSPIEYLTTIRVNEAKILLESTSYSIAEISDFTGFSSQSYFSQSFKSTLGVTPSQYRKSKLHPLE